MGNEKMETLELLVWFQINKGHQRNIDLCQKQHKDINTPEDTKTMQMIKHRICCKKAKSLL